MPEKSGIDALLSVGRTVGAAVCPQAGIAAAVNISKER
jgi:hypothetical protein